MIRNFKDSFYFIYQIFFKPITLHDELKKLKPKHTALALSIPLIIVFGIVGSVAFGIVDGIAFGIAFGIGVGIAFGIGVGIAGGIGVDIGVGIGVGIAFGIAGGIALGIAWGIAFGIAGGIAFGIAWGIAFGIAGGIGIWIGYFRLIQWIIESPIFLTCYAFARRGDSYISCYTLYRRASVLWDEFMMLPLPLLSRFLVLLARQDRDKGQEEIIRVAIKTNQQRAARIATLQLAAYDLSQCKTLEDIGLQRERLSWFMSASSPLTAQSKEALGILDDVIREIVAAITTTSDYIKQQDLQRVRTRLEGFQTQFVPTGLAGKEVSEFSRVAEAWIQIVKQELDRLAQRRIYERIPNPYISGPPVSPGQKSFVGRGEVFKFIEDNLVTLYQANTLVLFGPRKIGKTSILVNLSQYLPHNFIPVEIDMEGVAGIKNSNEFFYLIAKTIHDKLQSRYGLKTKEVLMDEYEKKNPFILFGEFLDDVEKVLTDRYKKEEDKNRLTRLLICLDEFEEIDTKIKQGVLEVDILKQFRNIMQHRERIVLLFTGMHTLEEMSKDYWSVFFGATRQLKISYLDKESAKQLITQPIPEFPLTYDDAAVERIISQTRCHPYLLQETCFNLVFYLNNQEREPPHATLEDVEKALEMTQEKLAYFFEGFVWGLAKTPEARAALVVLSSGKKNLEELEEELKKDGLKITKGKLLDTLKRLSAQDLIEQIKDKGNKPVWQFQIELARRWVSQEKSMQEVRV